MKNSDLRKLAEIADLLTKEIETLKQDKETLHPECHTMYLTNKGIRAREGLKTAIQGFLYRVKEVV